ncbi:hypothetical protein, partial [Aromatoleum buckelii]|uniref:hypothetical protein n=1 Tax=Aromatoleum buckelii TaxID=200254 RepID=UPI001FF1B411
FSLHRADLLASMLSDIVLCHVPAVSEQLLRLVQRLHVARSFRPQVTELDRPKTASSSWQTPSFWGMFAEKLTFRLVRV